MISNNFINFLQKKKKKENLFISNICHIFFFIYLLSLISNLQSHKRIKKKVIK